MLTYRTGAANTPAGAAAMVAHLGELTLAPAQAAIAAYYAGAKGPDPSDVAGFTGTVAQVRRDLDPALAQLLGLDPTRAPSADEIAHLLTGARADGQPIPGRQLQRDGTRSLAAELGLDPDRIATAVEVDRVLSGQRADTGAALPPGRVALLRRRFLQLYGIEERAGAIGLTEAVPHLREGRRGDGRPLRPTAYADGLTAAKQRISFIDLTLSTEKSLSIAIALTPSESERALLLAAHRDAVADVLRTAETVIGKARRGKAGRGGVEQGSVCWLTFEHFSARPTAEVVRIDPETGRVFTQLQTVRVAGDPQVHHHAIMPSCVLTPSGHVGGLHLAALAGSVKELGALYHAAVTVRLRRLGVTVEVDERTGAWRVAAIPESLRDLFSKRTAGGTEAAKAYAAAQGLDWDTLDGVQKIALLKAGTQDPRGAKQDDLGDIAVWQAEAAAAGWIPTRFIDLDTPIAEPEGEARLDPAYRAAAQLLGTAFENDAVLDESAVRTAAARGLIVGGYRGPEDVDVVVALLRERGLTQEGTATSLIIERVRGTHGQDTFRATTGMHAEREARLVALAQAAAQDRSGALTPEAIAVAAQTSGLTFEGEHGRAQAAAMVALGTGPRIAALTGAAGAGKSAVILPLAQAWQASGRRVYGISTAWRTAQALADAGIAPEDCLATAALLSRVDAGRIKLGPDDVVVVDEVGLMSTRTLLRILEVRERVGFRLLVVGDDLQATPVEAGSPLALLRRALGHEAIPAITTTLRQSAVEERELAGMAREGRIEEVLEVMRAAERAQLAPGSYEEAVEAVAALWDARMSAHADDPGFSLAVLAPTNRDARAIGQAIRSRRQDRGEIGPNEVTVEAVDQAGAAYMLTLAPGDEVRLFQRVNATGTGSRGLLGVNGSIVRVVAISADGLVLRNGQSGRQGRVAWSTLRDPETGRTRLAPGGCLSIDQAQGLTADEAIFALPGGAGSCDAGRAYVALSRHRRHAYLVLGEAAERRAVAQKRPLGTGSIKESDLWQHAGAVLARRATRATALDVLDRARACHAQALALRRTTDACLDQRVGATTTIPARRQRNRIAQFIAILVAADAGRAVLLQEFVRRLASILSEARARLAQGRADVRDADTRLKRGRRRSQGPGRPHRPTPRS